MDRKEPKESLEERDEILVDIGEYDISFLWFENFKSLSLFIRREDGSRRCPTYEEAELIAKKVREGLRNA